MSKRRGAAFNRPALTQVAATAAPEAFKKVLREVKLINWFSSEGFRSALDRFGRRIPRRHGAVKVRVIGLVAGNGRVVAEDLVLDHMLPRLDGAEEVGDVVGGVVVALRRRIALHLAQLCRRRGMPRMPL